MFLLQIYMSTCWVVIPISILVVKRLDFGGGYHSSSLLCAIYVWYSFIHNHLFCFGFYYWLYCYLCFRFCVQHCAWIFGKKNVRHLCHILNFAHIFLSYWFLLHFLSNMWTSSFGLEKSVEGVMRWWV
jgi:hypothetical protein